VSVEPTGDLAAAWRGITQFVRANRQRADQEARDTYHRERAEITRRAEAERWSESEEARQLKRLTKTRDEALALAARLWPSLDDREKETRAKAKAAAEAAITEVWRAAIAAAEESWPDWSYRSPAAGYV
jgi:hypothetical protein